MWATTAPIRSSPHTRTRVRDRALSTAAPSPSTSSKDQARTSGESDRSDGCCCRDQEVGGAQVRRHGLGLVAGHAFGAQRGVEGASGGSDG